MRSLFDHQGDIIITKAMMETAWRSVPTFYEIDTENDEAMRLMLRAVLKSLLTGSIYKVTLDKEIALAEFPPPTE